MATLQERNGSYRILFLHGGTRHTFTLGKVPKAVADGKAARVEEVLSLLKSGYLALPAGTDVLTFVRNDGKPPASSKPTKAKKPLTIRELRDEYLRVHEGSLERTTTVGMRRHFGHLLATLGESFPVPSLTLADLQRHADRRAKATWRGKKLAPATVRKELVTLRTAWNWGVHMGLLEGRFPALKRVKTAKADEKPPFMTWAEIERRLPGLSAEKQAELWDALYLRQEEVAELLDYVKANATLPWVYPLVCTAAYTGARKSELIRMELHDVDLADGTLQVRERKRRHDRKTTRRVSLTPALETVLREWLAIHPGGVHLFSQAGEVFRSKKRGRTTGHQVDGKRATTVAGRRAGVRRRPAQDVAQLTVDEVHDHFKRTLRGSRWECVKGLHTLRHSFISCLAAAGVDQRIIDDFAGHSTDQQRLRYRHLFPDVKQKAIASVFG